MSTIRRPKGSQFDLFDMHIVQDILSHYDLGEALGLKTLIIDGGIVVNLMERSDTSKKVVVRCESGNYFLKQVPWYCNNIQQLGFSLEFENHLFNSGFSTPRPVRAKSELLYSEYQKTKFILFELMPGSLFSYKKIECIKSAEALAELHKISEKWKFPETAPRSSLLQIVDEHITLAKQLATERNEYASNQELFNVLSSVSIDTFNIKCHKHIPVHGDYIPWNIGYQHGVVSSVYDFDNASVDSRMHDIGEAITAFFALRYAGNSAALTRTDILTDIAAENIAEFLNAYETVLPLSVSEKKLLPEYIAGAWWESLLLGYIKGELPIEVMSVLPNLIEISRRRCYETMEKF